MTVTPDSSSEPKPKRILKLNDLFPDKTSVETSRGTLYVRYADTKDWQQFSSDDIEDLGKAAVILLSSTIADKNDHEPLRSEDFESLNNQDLQALVKAIAKVNNWQDVPSGCGVNELGEVVKAARKRRTEKLAELNKSISESYGFLEKSALATLQDQMAGLSKLRNGIAGLDTSYKAISPFGSLDDLIKPSASVEAFERAMKGTDLRDRVAAIKPTQSHPLPSQLHIHRPEETKLGRATLESAQNSREVARQMVELVDLIAGLHQTMINDVLPAWAKRIQEEQEGAKDAMKQAAAGLWWTKWAVIASVLIAILTTWWQVSVATRIDNESTKQQKRLEELLEKQLSTQQKLIEQQIADNAAMREAITSIKPAPMVATQKNDVR